MSVTRREFLGTSAAAASAAALGPVLGQSCLRPETRPTSASPRSAFNGQGNGHIQHNHQNLVALCDVDEEVLHDKADELKQTVRQEARHLHRLPQAARAQGHRRRLDRHAEPHARADRHRRGPGRQARLRREAGVAQHLGRPADDPGRPAEQPHHAMRHAVALQPQPARRPSHSSAAASSAKSSTRSAPATSRAPASASSTSRSQIPSTIDYDLWCGPAAKERPLPPESALRLALGLQHRQRRHGQPGHPPDGHRPLVPRRKRRSPRGRSASAAGSATKTPATRPTRRSCSSIIPTAPLIFETRGLPRSHAAQTSWGDAHGSLPRLADRRDRAVRARLRAGAELRRRDRLRRRRPRDQALGDPRRRARRPHQAICSRPWRPTIRRGSTPTSTKGISPARCATWAAFRTGLGKPARGGEITEQIKGNELLSISFDRMASHLRANGVDIDGGEGALTLGPWLELDPATEQFTNNDAATELALRAKQREPFAVPDLERNAVAKTG